ncbi:uncharacterized protein LOC119404519 isoform X4 [Rhipicephalus sanguineus]|uniref:uncharacterized protein LOC119404519 isoform X3 n=1 Tax=Rhipicephalus sanguineus TaxID=34632 RepID=UPI0020C35992|nr:uncharacterized protein LOC119404519 isoform X3 [Rhipicephalus sanguineus]XP_049274872.1 uncharacterized protein LOC119404519 isoform X4 [Rhipicephalus sanguineus]XP_049274873.1 uncharacterized protein LOC119404519 isoform X4 [Rhipicephalus sanguineus]XP_049274874.1 uncharacterized protein LOC119404519 isoform X4 [Rhipicephalus sanguineus]
MGLCSRKDPTWGCSWRSRGRHFVPDFWCVMGVFAGRKASSLCNCLVGLSPLFKKLATFELQICTTHRVGDLLRAERSFKLAARPECTWTSRGFALKRYSSADVLTRPVPLRRIFRTIADGSLDGCWTCSRHWIESADCLHTSPVPQRQIFLAGILPALPQLYKLFMPPGLATADKDIVKQFQRQQHIGIATRIVVTASFNIGIKQNGR